MISISFYNYYDKYVLFRVRLKVVNLLFSCDKIVYRKFVDTFLDVFLFINLFLLTLIDLFIFGFLFSRLFFNFQILFYQFQQLFISEKFTVLKRYCLLVLLLFLRLRKLFKIVHFFQLSLCFNFTDRCIFSTFPFL